MITRLLHTITRQKDLFLIVAIVLILLMMILPLPQVLMDLFITINMSAAIMVLLVAIHLHSPVGFSTFPALLLITTLFRLAISVSTTRLILIDGDAGQIVATFGEVVVSGNLIVGLVIFLIITVVQFLVITKGADRVAEVSARFTLDGLPGKQMSVDADLRAGIIDEVDAKQRRTSLEQETKLFGAMDGAMKFVKGDAVAGLVITAINLIGGITIGMAQRGLGFSEALEVYSLLTIGDGLVSQIPALLISIASGTIVTRVTTSESSDLGSDISRQITSNSRTIFIAGIIIIFFGFIPGFPTHIFAMVGLGLSGGIFLAARKQRNLAGSWKSNWASFIEIHNEKCADARLRTNSDPTLTLILPEIVQISEPALFAELFEETRLKLDAKFGVPTGYWRFEFVPGSSQSYTILIAGQNVATGKFDPDILFVRGNSTYLDTLGIAYLYDFEDEEACWVSKTELDKIKEFDLPYEDALTCLFRHVDAVTVDQLSDFVGISQTAQILTDAERNNSVLVADLKSNLSTGQISGILKRLTDEQLPITNIIGILEAILEWAPKDPNPIQVVEKVRVSIGEHIVRRLAPSKFLPVAIIAPSLESQLRDGLRTVQHESFLVLESTYSEEIAKQVRKFVHQPFVVEKDPVLITQSDVRRHLHCMLLERGIRIPVISYQEVPPDVMIYPVGYVQTE